MTDAHFDYTVYFSSRRANTTKADEGNYNVSIYSLLDALSLSPFVCVRVYGGVIENKYRHLFINIK